MPKLIRLYLVSIAVGFALSALFVGALLWFDVAGLQRLILGSPGGRIGGVMLVLFNGIVFAGAQFGVAVMRMAEPEERGGPRGGRPVPALVAATHRASRSPRRRAMPVPTNAP
jgi:hypothetical protein